MAVRIRDVRNINILDIDGKVDINSSDIVETVGWLVNTGKVNLIINLDGVDTVDYNGISVLTIAYKNIMNHKGKVRFINVPLSVTELLKVVKLETVFEIYPDEESAVGSFYEESAEKAHLRRKFERLDIHLIVKYKIRAAKKTQMFEGRVLNISGAGLYVYTQNTFPISTMLDMEFTLPNVKTVLEANGRVSWLADKEIQPHAYPGMGISFVHLTTRREKAIIGFIEKNIIHRTEPI